MNDLPRDAGPLAPVTNPYVGAANQQFWRRVMSGRTAGGVDPVGRVPFTIGPKDKVATAGSCFAQHIARFMQSAGYNYYVAEPAPSATTVDSESYGVYSARYGNLYTVRQLWQLFQRSHGLFEPLDDAWRNRAGTWIDPFRPRINENGFVSRTALNEDRERHFAAVRTMFEMADVFVMTLGLTEGWANEDEGAVVPFHPGAIGAIGQVGRYRFCNFSVSEMEADLASFISALRTVNPACRVILTVSPVALIATYEDDHVLCATTYSKAALRVVAETARRTHENVAYFPSYEIICGPQSGGAWFEPDLREVRPEAVAHVMQIFARHYLSNENVVPLAPSALKSSGAALMVELDLSMRVTQKIICDEIVLDLPSSQ